MIFFVSLTGNNYILGVGGHVPNVLAGAGHGTRTEQVADITSLGGRGRRDYDPVSPIFQEVIRLVGACLGVLNKKKPHCGCVNWAPLLWYVQYVPG